METNRKVVVIMGTHRLKIEMNNHHSPVFSADTEFGLSFESILGLLGNIAPYADDPDMVAEMSYDIGDALEFSDGGDYQALVGLINDSARFVVNELTRATRLYPGRELYFDRLVGESAHYTLE